MPLPPPRAVRPVSAPVFPHIECIVTFLPRAAGGRWDLPDLTGDRYRPHLVVGDPGQRKAVVGPDRVSAEDYLGVAFADGFSDYAAGEEVLAVATLLYYSDHAQGYDRLEPGATFTIREGATVVGYGTVLGWLPPARPTG